jgi:subtilase family serine protease
LFCLLTVPAFAQQFSPQPLITRPIDESQLMTLKGNTHPLAQPQFDVGIAAPNLPLQRMLLVLKRSPQQDFALRTLLDDQQDKASTNYHKWVTPDEFGVQFGPSDQDVQLVTGWLQSHGFQVNRVAHGRSVIEFSGVESQVEGAFHTQIHAYMVNGQQHWANASDPQIPAALAPAVAGVLSLNNFPAQPMLHLLGTMSRDKSTGQVTPVNPSLTLNGNCGVQNHCYGVGPYDFATIYNVAPLWNATPAIDGTGQTIAIVGETDINPQDIADFRNFFGLPPVTLNVIHDGQAPGILHNGEETESDLDVEWSSAVAKGATIDFVVSQATETTRGVDLSALYIIDNNLAPVMSESYGFCELGLGTAGNQAFNAMWEQAAAQGITVMISSGDNGAAGCELQCFGPVAIRPAS